MKVLILEPHPDDTALNMLGYILNNPKNNYYNIVFSKVNKVVFSEWFMFINKLNLDYLYFNFKRRQFYKHSEKINNILSAIKNDYKPDIIFCPSDKDIHQDHKIINNCALTIFGKDTSIIFYGNHNHNLDFNYFIILDDYVMNEKLDILKLFKSQKDRDYFNTDFVKSKHLLNKKEQYAEKFKIFNLFNYGL